MLSPASAESVDPRAVAPDPTPAWADDWFHDSNRNRIDDELEALVQQGETSFDFMVTFGRASWDANRAILVSVTEGILESYGAKRDRDFSILPTLLAIDAPLEYPLWTEEDGYIDPLMAALLDDDELGVVMIEALHMFIPARMGPGSGSEPGSGPGRAGFNSDHLYADHVMPDIWTEPTLWSVMPGYTGLIAIIDTGIMELGYDPLKIAGGYDAVTQQTTNPSDVTAGGLFHGTRVEYLATGLGYGGLYGVAPLGGFIDVRVAVAPSDTTSSDYIIAAFDWLLLHQGDTWSIPGDPLTQLTGIDAVNVSYSDNGPLAHRFVPGGGGGSGCANLPPSDGSDNVSRAADTLAVVAGIQVAAAAGNCGEQMFGFGMLAASARALTVGAYDTNGTPTDAGDDTMYSWSNHGPGPYLLQKPDLVAPGGIWGEEGTSFSTPQVTGTLGILRALYPNESPAGLKSAITRSAVEGPLQSGFAYDWGHGRLHSGAALDTLVADQG
jgi:hypothetical protein